jgi:hypothetical protein
MYPLAGPDGTVGVGLGTGATVVLGAVGGVAAEELDALGGGMVIVLSPCVIAREHPATAPAAAIILCMWPIVRARTLALVVVCVGAGRTSGMSSRRRFPLDVLCMQFPQ